MILETYTVEEKGLRELKTRQLKQHVYLDFPVIIFLATNKANRVAEADFRMVNSNPLCAISSNNGDIGV